MYVSVCIYSTLDIHYELVSHRRGVEYLTVFNDLYSTLALVHAYVFICMISKTLAGRASDDPFDLGMSLGFRVMKSATTEVERLRRGINYLLH